MEEMDQSMLFQLDAIDESEEQEAREETIEPPSLFLNVFPKLKNEKKGIIVDVFCGNSLS